MSAAQMISPMTFPNQIMYAFLSFPTYAECSARLGSIRYSFSHQSIIREGWKLWHSSCYVRLSPLTKYLTPRRQNPEVHHRIHNSPPPVFILSKVNPLHNPQPIFLWPILIPYSHLRLGFPSALSFGLSHQNPCTLSSPLPCVPHALPTSLSLIWSAQ
jgi:hypothetical protein